MMISIGLRTGFRQKNLRELRIFEQGNSEIPLEQLIELRCGQISFCKESKLWRVFVPHHAFKNSSSGYFKGRHYRLDLSDSGELYPLLEEYVTYGRPALLAGRTDENFLFTKNMRSKRVNSSGYSETGFYEAWRQIIQRYGIYNPYTKRGAIRGLLPHGPHAVRHILATHVIKTTGSFEMAGYAIQDTAEMVERHYARFLPQDKAGIAAAVLRDCWT
ncbi:hypothetical protein [Caulobacter endophyticus]|uniref:hypothetical protein n=1 Tax=Caulobacter endophyticus TaxID=2172652 RepID=UPI00240FEAD0|nr:hypothetical protein [Caulobacter endophyticus]MDG2528033.1 hypothetical protein [Caulobacter endophyticus]